MNGLRALAAGVTASFDHGPLFETIVDRMLRAHATTLRSVYPDMVELEVLAIEQARLGDVLARGEGHVFGIVRIDPGAHHGLVAANPALAQAAACALLGGRNPGQERRPLTNIQLGLVERLFVLMLRDLAQAFEPVAAMAFRVERMETSARFAAILAPGTAVVLARLRYDLLAAGGEVTLVLPVAALTPLQDAGGRSLIGAGTDERWRERLARHLLACELAIDVVPADEALPFEAVAAAGAGATLRFAATASQPSAMIIDGHVLGAGALSDHDGQLAVRWGQAPLLLEHDDGVD
jgi:flagellar motor switch protein FliM